MSNEFYSSPNLSLLLCHSDLSLEALSCGRLSDLTFDKARAFHTFIIFVAKICCLCLVL